MIFVKKLQITRKNFFFFLIDKFLFIFKWKCRSKIFFYWFCYIFEIHFLYWKLVQIFLLKINWFLPASFFYWKSTRIFLLKLILNCDFVLKINEKFSIEKQLNFRITLYFLYRDFQRHFSMILLYFWNCHFIRKTNHLSIENQLVFASIIFLLPRKSQKNFNTSAFDKKTTNHT